MLGEGGILSVQSEVVVLSMRRRGYTKRAGGGGILSVQEGGILRRAGRWGYTKPGGGGGGGSQAYSGRGYTKRAGVHTKRAEGGCILGMLRGGILNGQGKGYIKLAGRWGVY